MSLQRHWLVGMLLAVVIGILVVRSGWAAEDAINTTYFDNNPGSGMTYTGAWTHATSGWPKAYNSSISWTNSVGAKTSLSFYGSSITRMYSMAANRGSATIWIDGTNYGQSNDFSPNVNNDPNYPVTRWQVAKTWSFPTGYHTIEVRQAGGGYTDADAFIVDIPTVTNGNFDDTHAQYKYVGNWTHATGWTDAYNGSLSWSKNLGDAVTFTFTGDNVTYFFTRSWNRGKVVVTIDGVDKGLIDLYNFTPAFKQMVSWSGLGGAVHTIHLSITNQKNSASTDYYVDVDMIKAGVAYNREYAINYADAWAHSRNAYYPSYGVEADGTKCDDCTNFISQVLEVGGIPQIVDTNGDNQYVWYAKPQQPGAWYVSPY